MASIIYIIFYFFIFLCLTASLYLFQLVSMDMLGPRVIFNTLGRDLRAAYRFMKVKSFVRKCHSRNLTIGEIFQQLVKKHQNKVCFIFEGQEWTFKQVEDYSNQVANCFAAIGYQKGDEIALFMENRPEYVCVWLGLSKIGVVPAFINTNLRLTALAHSMNVVNTKAIIYGADLASAVKDVIPLLDKKDTVECFCLGNIEENSMPLSIKSLDLLLEDMSKNPPDKKKYQLNFQDKLLYIYTSGTTGLPKAAIIRHSRFAWIAAGIKHIMNLSDEDVVYNPLPMYHTAGGLLFLSFVLTFGGTMVIRKKFSATNFWSDAIKYNATVSQYIGETCRFLLNQPKKPEETQHKIRLMVGNGLRPQIWKEFVDRFQIKCIIEIYGSTEGNANVVNIFGKVGSVGFISRIFQRLHPVSLIRVDPETGQPIRNKEGLCVRCKPGEPGELVGKIITNSPINAFDGYASETATRKKIVRNCFHTGDMAFLSGDILVMDENGYLFFMDRTGDTFRWRGENVSTSEVEGIVSKVLGLLPCVVYGVKVPGVEGSAGMAAIQSDANALDMELVFKAVSKALPSYAIPVFVRICRNIESTGTYKLKKVDLRKEGYDPEKVPDPLFFLDPKSRSYVQLDKQRFHQICEGNVRL